MTVKRATDLFGEIANFSALIEAAKRASKGKRSKPGVAAFMAGLERNVLALERGLSDETWQPGKYTVLEIRDPKPRKVSAAPFRDRVLHHALCAVVVPLFERGFINDTFANQKGKGTHRAVRRYEHFRDRYRYVLHGDIYRFFPAIDHQILKTDLRRRLACKRTLRLLDVIIDGSNPQEPVHHYFPGDDLFTPHARRRGLPIGNLTSQFFGNLYLDGFDHWIKEVMRVHGYVRYVDDFALFHDDVAQLQAWREELDRYLSGRRLIQHPSKTQILATTDASVFLGYELCKPGLRRLPEENVRRFRDRLRGMRDRWRAGQIDEPEVRQHVQSWIAHASQANTWRLRHAIFHGGWFDPVVLGELFIA